MNDALKPSFLLDTGNIKGLYIFIRKIKDCPTKGEEWIVINEELGKIRSLFNGSKPVSGYDKKKSICKLLFMFLLGYDCDLGFLESVNLFNFNTYSEKYVGYLFLSVITSANKRFSSSVINVVEDDLTSENNIFKNLALQYIANTATKDIVDRVKNLVLNIVLSTDDVEFVKQSAILALLHLLRIQPDIVSECEADVIVNQLSNERLGVLTPLVSLIDFLLKIYPALGTSCVPLAVSRLSKLVIPTFRHVKDYNFYCVPAPWLCVKLLQLLKTFPKPTEPIVLKNLVCCLKNILNEATDQERYKKEDADYIWMSYAVIMEAISCIMLADLDFVLVLRSVEILGNLLRHPSYNLKYVALQTMTVSGENTKNLGFIREHWLSISHVLNTGTDKSMRKTALDLLYILCDASKVKEVVEAMLQYLKKSLVMQEDVAVKAVILAEKFQTDPRWYVKTIFRILRECRNINESVCFRLAKGVKETPKVQAYAAKLSCDFLKKSKCNDSTIKVAAYFLGKFGYMISSHPEYTCRSQLSILNSYYANCAAETKSVILTAFLKFIHYFPELKAEVQSIFTSECNNKSASTEVQRRALEYLRLSEITSKEFLGAVLTNILPYQGKSSVIKELSLNSNHSSNGDSAAAKCEAITKKSATLISDVGDTVAEKQRFPNSQLQLYHPTALISANEVNSSLKLLRMQNNQSVLQSWLFRKSDASYEDGILKVWVRSYLHKQYLSLFVTKCNISVDKAGCFWTCAYITQGEFTVWFKPFIYRLGPGESIQQTIHLKCYSRCRRSPAVILNCFEGTRKMLELSLPGTKNMLLEPAAMSFELFRQRREGIGSKCEITEQFESKYLMLCDAANMKL